jgi:hypothetical protein
MGIGLMRQMSRRLEETNDPHDLLDMVSPFAGLV